MTAEARFESAARARLRAADVARVAQEAAPRVRGAAIRRVRPRGPGFVLDLRGPDGEVALVCSVSGPVPFLACVPRAEAPGTGERVHGFSARLRALLTGARVRELRAVPGDRIAVLDLSVSGSRAWRLWLCLMGTRADAVLVDEEGSVLASARAFAGRKGAAHGRYTPPALPPGREERRAAQGPAGSARARAAASAGGLSGGAMPDARALSVGRRVLAAADQAAAVAARAEVARRLRRELKARRRRLSSALERLEREAAGLPAAAKARRKGELLAASLHLVAPRARWASVPDYYAPLTGGEPPRVRIELDPERPPKEQPARYFKRARKGERAAEVAAARLPPVRAELRQLAEAAAALEAGEEPTGVAARLGIGPPDGTRGRPRRGRPGRAGGAGARPVRRFQSRDGREVWVGRSGVQNETLTLRKARGTDVFFHVSGFPGAHVIVRAEAKPLTQDALLDAAELAVYYSKARGRTGAEVRYTPCRFVRRPKGAAAGTVLLTRFETIYVRPERTRLERVLATGGREGGVAGGSAERGRG